MFLEKRKFVKGVEKKNYLFMFTYVYLFAYVVQIPSKFVSQIKFNN